MNRGHVRSRYAKGVKLDARSGIRDQPAWDDHAKFFDPLVEHGLVILGGPISSRSDDEVALLAVEAADEHELRSIFGGTPGPRMESFASRTFGPGPSGSTVAKRSIPEYSTEVSPKNRTAVTLIAGSQWQLAEGTTAFGCGRDIA